MADKHFSSRLLSWFDQYGRKDLPWQTPRTAYRVWISEIMLQQTQVKTVIGYFQRFMQRFESLEALATASEDEVLHYWSGLGYYARCRNLHKTAILLYQQGIKELPAERLALEALPGIGRSTAAAIVAQVWNQPEAILDGNVKRVLARHQSIEGWTGSSAVQNKLWSLAESLMPKQRVADYTQAIMDLGATICKRSKPLCTQCPVSEDCEALKNNCVTTLPTPKKKKKLSEKSRRFLIILDSQQRILLEKRPPTGIWGGLWSLPEMELADDINDFCQRQLGIKIKNVMEQNVVKHSFSHYHLYITPTVLEFEQANDKVQESGLYHWYYKDQSDALGLAAPVSAIIAAILKSN